MKRQEKFNLIISLLALIVSMGTATYDKVATYREEKRKESQKLYIAYSLGQRVIQAYIWANQVNPKTEPEREQANREILFQLSNAQGLADSLDLRMNVRDVFQSTDPAQPDDPFSNRIFSTGQERLQTVAGHRAAAAYDLGTWLLWAFVESKIVAGDRVKESALIQSYARVRDHINDDLQELGMADKMPKTVFSVKDIEAASSHIKKNLDEKWEY